MKKINKIALALGLMALCSCNDLLDVKNPSGIYGSDYWANKDEVFSYLLGTYTVFRSTLNTMEYLEARGDEFEPGLEDAGTNMWAQNISSTTAFSWASYYTTIQHCNMIIKHIENVKYSLASEKDQVLAEAYTMRAMMYFNIVRLWGKCPLELIPTEGSSKELSGRAPIADVMNQIFADLETAVSLFPSNDWPVGKSRASKRGAYALMADAYLWRAKALGGGDADLNNVVRYADLAAEGSSLEESFSSIYGTRNGKEVIWSIYYGYPETSGDSYTHFMTLRDVFVEKAVNKDEVPYAKSGARSRYTPSAAFRALVSKYQGDVREKGSFIDAVNDKGVVLGTSQVKMPGTKTSTNVIFDNDNVLYRHAEMILFKAEAYAALGQTDAAIEELNKVRRRAGIGNYAGAKDKTSVELEILDERGREFFLENKRWPDLLRFHYEGLIDVYQIIPKLKERKDAGTVVPLYLPIPITEIGLNHKLEQTEGYEEL